MKYEALCLNRDKTLTHRAVAKPYKIDIDTLKINPNRTIIRLGHRGQIIGEALNVKPTEKGLEATFKIYSPYEETVEKNNYKISPTIDTAEPEFDGGELKNGTIKDFSLVIKATDNETYLKRGT